MKRWARGEGEIDALLAAGSLERVSGARADGAPWLLKATRTLATATGIGPDDPESSFVLAYDAARHACCGLLAQQGLRATSKGGHYAVDRAVSQQFAGPLTAFGALRRRRNELEYPSYPGERVEPDELTAAHRDATAICHAAAKLLHSLGLF